MDREELVNQLFEHALQMHGFALGTMMRPQRVSSERALEELEPMQKRLVDLYQAAGRPVPTCLEREGET